MMQNQDLLQHLQELVVIHAGSQMIYPLVMTNIAIEHGPVKIVDLPINSMVIFHSYVNVYQMVPLCKAMRQLVGGMRAEPVERTHKVRSLTETWEMEQAQAA